MADESILTELHETVAGLRWLAQYLYRAESRQTETLALLRGNWENDLLFSGTVQTDAHLRYLRTFAVPFAAVTISDPHGVGPIYVATTADFQWSDASDNPFVGPGRFYLPAKCHVTMPLTGKTLQLAAATQGAQIALAVYVTPKPFFIAETP